MQAQLEEQHEEARHEIHQGIPACGRRSGRLVWAADPAPKEADWIARDFRFHSGETLPEVRLHYTTIGAPSGEPVLLLHGTAGAGATLLGKDFAGELFGPGRPLDASLYFIILPTPSGRMGRQ